MTKSWQQTLSVFQPNSVSKISIYGYGICESETISYEENHFCEHSNVLSYIQKQTYSHSFLKFSVTFHISE